MQEYNVSYLHTCNKNYQSLVEKAKQHGATYSRLSFVKTYYGQKEGFIEHFFNDENKEVALIILAKQMYELSGITIFDSPRIWDQTFLQHPNIGEPVDLDTLCVRQLVNPLC